MEASPVVVCGDGRVYARFTKLAPLWLVFQAVESFFCYRDELVRWVERSDSKHVGLRAGR
jgi:hypothetical protein